MTYLWWEVLKLVVGCASNTLRIFEITNLRIFLCGPWIKADSELIFTALFYGVYRLSDSEPKQPRLACMPMHLHNAGQSQLFVEGIYLRLAYAALSL